MLKIVKVKIPRNTLVSLMQSERAALNNLRELVPLNSDGDGVASAPMVSTSVAYDIVKDALRHLLGSSQDYLEDITAHYVIVRTRAPKDYDYAYCLDVGIVEGERGPERIIAIPQKSVTYQTNRYGSGLYGSVLCD